MNQTETLKKRLIRMISFFAIGLLMSLAFLSVGIYLIVDTQNKIRTYTPITATVIDHKLNVPHNSHKNSTTFAEVAQFTVDGKTYTVTNSVSSNMPAEIGSKLTIYYNPDNPNECIFPGSSNLFSIIWTTFSSVFTLIVTVTMIIEIKKYRKLMANNKKEEKSDVLQNLDDCF